MMIFARVSLVFLIVQGAVACKKRAHNDSQIQHIPATFLRDSSRYQWITIEDSEVKESMVDFGPELVAPQVTARLQTWVDKIDERIRSLSPERFADVPRPRIKIFNNEAMGAFAVTAVACTPYVASIRGKGGNNSPEAKSNNAFVWSQTGKLSLATPQCLPAKNFDASGYVEWHNKNNRRCTLTLKGNLIEYGANCPATPEVEQLLVGQSRVSGQAFRYNVSSNIIAVMSGTFRYLKSEESVIAILAHELGHFYRAHTAAFSYDDLEYVYKRSANDHDGVPVPDPQFKNFAREAGWAERIHITAPMTGEQKIATEIYRGAYGEISSRLIEACRSKNDSCTPSCRDFVSTISADPYARISESLRYQGIEPSQKTAFLEIDRKLFACAQTLTPERSPVECIKLFGFNEIACIKDSSLGAGMLKINAKLVQMRANVAAIHSKVKKVLGTEYGFYSVEQEADDLSTEFLSLVGVNPRALIGTMFESAEVSGFGEAGENDLSVSECRKLLENGWKDSSGKAVQIPIATTERHHGSCYRVFNLDNEARRHHYRVDEAQRPAFGESWESLIGRIALP